jgi:hypothetical protein
VGATLLALAAALILVIAPGLLLSYAGPRTWDTAQRLALAPGLSLGALWAVVTVATRTHLSISPVTVTAGLAVVAALGTWALAVGRRDRAASATSAAPWSPDRWDAAGLAVVVVLGLALWWLGTDGLAQVAPNDDGANHGVWTARIIATGSVEPSQVMVGDVGGTVSATTFYPWALHVLASVLPTSSVGVALDVAVATVTNVALPLGMFVLARRTFPTARRAPLAVAAVAVVASAYPVGPTFWGGFPLIAAMALVPALVDAVADLLQPADRTSPVPWWRGAVVGVAAAGLFFTQSSTVVTAAMLTLCVLAGARWQSRARLAIRTALRPLAVAVLAFAAVLLPWAGAIGDRARAVGEASPVVDTDSGAVVVSLLTTVLGPASTLVVGLLLVPLGVVVALRRSQGASWLLFAAWVTALSLLVGFGLPGGAALTSPWYSELLRTRLNLVYPAAAFLGLGAWWLARAVARRLGPAPVADPRVARAVPVTVALAVVALPVVGLLSVAATGLLRDSTTGGTGFRTGGSLATPDARASWAWLREHVTRGDQVLNQFADGSTWMYAEDGLAPVYLSRPTLPLDGDAGYLLTHAASVRTDPKASAAARALHVRFAYAGDRLFPLHDRTTTPHLDVDAMVAGGWRVVQRTATTVVLEIPAGT